MLDLLGVQPAVAQQRRVSEYGAQWRAQFMRNQGEEFILHPIGLFSLLSRLLLDFVKARPLDGQRDAVGRQLQQPHIVFGKAPGADRAGVNHADDPSFRDERRADQRTRISSQSRVRRLRRREVLHNERSAVRRNGTGHAASDRNTKARRGLLQSDSGSHGQSPAVFRQQEDRGGVGLEQFPNPGQHLAQQIVERKTHEDAVGHSLQPPYTLRRMFRLGARRPLANEQLFALGFDLLAVMDIGRGPDPFHDPSLLVANRTPARQVPAELAVLAAKSVLGLKRLPGLAGLPQPTPRDFTVVGVNRLYPFGSEGLLYRNAYILDPPLIAIIHQPVRPAGVNDLGHGVGELAEARLALDNHFFGLLPRSNVVMRDDNPAALPVQRRY